MEDKDYFHCFRSSNKYIIGKDIADIKIAYNLNSIKNLIEWIEQEQKSAKYIFAFFSYESAKFFNNKMQVKKLNDFPYAYAASYHTVEQLTHKKTTNNISLSNYNLNLDYHNYHKNMIKIKSHLINGDIYQINYSIKNNLQLNLKSKDLFFALNETHPSEFSSLFCSHKLDIISLSPELFIERKGQKILMQPMKGTIKKGTNQYHNQKLMSKLFLDQKTRAENLMIVDLIRNDLSKICTTGSVKVSNLFKINSYSYINQMVSSVHGILKKNSSFLDIMTATFPSGSITGTPKIKAMEIINNLEKQARGIYTGAIFLFKPYGDFISSVAIRTMTKTNTKTTLGLGSGIVMDSKPKEEWYECLLKGDFLFKEKFNFLFETILFDKNTGFLWLEKHLNRLENSCNKFSIVFPKLKLLDKISKLNFDKNNNYKINIKIDRNSKITLHKEKFYNDWDKKEKLKIKISSIKTNSSNIFLYHKSNNRKLYNKELMKAQKLGFDEILFCNEKNEVTEGSYTNIFILSKKNQWITPSLTSGLLNGIWRQIMLKKLQAKEKNIYIKDLEDAKQILIGNSLRLEKQSKLIK